jgi:hypothetical protein
MQMSVDAQSPVGAAEGCDLFILASKKQNKNISALGSSYRGSSQGKKKWELKGSRFL